MVEMLDFTGESALSISVDILAAILDYGTGLQHQLQECFAALDNPYKVVLDDSLVHLDEKLNILAAILAAILDSGYQIATPTSGMVFADLDNPYRVVLDDSLVHLD